MSYPLLAGRLYGTPWLIEPGKAAQLEAVFRAYYAQLNADLQQRAIALGGSVTYLTDEEATRYDETNRGVLGRPWSLWKQKFAPHE